MTAGLLEAPAPLPRITIGARTIPVQLPKLHDPRLKLSTVVITLHVLGQTLLGWKVSIAQIAVSMLFCAVVEGALLFRSSGVLVWPASGLLTGSSIALILRASGTRHGDWWSLHGIEFFLLAGAVSLLSKHLLRSGGRHRFNPSNIGIVWCLLVVGPNHVFAQYLWWGPSRIGVTLAYVVICLGALWVLRAVRMMSMAAAFVLPFAVVIGVYALLGSSFVAIWHVGPVSGLEYWANIALSPEVLVFVFFMISDPQTAPKTSRGRVAYGAVTALIAAAFIPFQATEFGIKVALLASLTVACTLVPLLDRAVVRPTPGKPRLRLRPAVLAMAVIAVAVPLDTALLAHNQQIVLIENGQSGARTAQ